MTKELTEHHILELTRLASEYAERKNLDPYVYIKGIFEPLARDGEGLDVYEICVILIKYHKDWLKDLK